MTDTTSTPATVTPGYKTTEFWLKIAALVLTALFASGIIPTTGPAAQVAAIAATILGALGYTVGRSLVKAAGATLILLALGTTAGTMTACSAAQARQTAAAGTVAALECEDGHIDAAALADAQAFAAAKVQAWISGTVIPDLAALKAKIKADLAPIKSDLGKCAITGALAAATTIVQQPGVAVSALSSLGSDQAVAAFSVAARAAGWAPVHVGGATL